MYYGTRLLFQYLIRQWLKPFNVESMLRIELELPTACEIFENLRFFIEFGALFQQSGKKSGDVLSRQELRPCVI